MAIRIGIGSWADDEYKGVLYPDGLPAKDRLKHYATHFSHVEVNSTYYASPRAANTASWAKQVPAGFAFNIKLHKAFSQDPKKTATDGKMVEWLLSGVAPLVAEKKFGTFLLVLEPSFGPEKRRLDELDVLAKKLQPHVLAVELRHNGWVEESRRAQTLEYFRERQIAWVAVDMPRLDRSTMMPPIDEVTSADVAYLRLHGRNKNWFQAKSAGERHAYDYSSSELEEIAARVRKLAAKAVDVHVFANNHSHDYAPRAALALKKLLAC